jgi:exodeoxyribonuclease VII small subunit
VSEEPRPDIAELRFGEALGQLEAIVRELESGDLDLEDSLERYQRGVELLRACRSRLTDAEARITSLLGEIEQDAEEA